MRRENPNNQKGNGRSLVKFSTNNEHIPYFVFFTFIIAHNFQTRHLQISISNICFIFYFSHFIPGKNNQTNDFKAMLLQKKFLRGNRTKILAVACLKLSLLYLNRCSFYETLSFQRSTYFRYSQILCYWELLQFKSYEISGQLFWLHVCEVIIFIYLLCT